MIESNNSGYAFLGYALVATNFALMVTIGQSPPDLIFEHGKKGVLYQGGLLLCIAGVNLVGLHALQQSEMEETAPELVAAAQFGTIFNGILGVTTMATIGIESLLKRFHGINNATHLPFGVNINHGPTATALSQG